MSTQDGTRRRVEEALAAPLRAAGYDVEAVDLTPAGRRRVLRVAVDKDGGVSLDDVAEVTREVSRLLDEHGTMGEAPYTLEVTSRGVDRPLTLARHYRRNVDRLVAVDLADGSSVTGRVLGVEGDVVTLDVDGRETGVALADVRRALVQVEFNRRGPAGERADDLDDADDADDADDSGLDLIDDPTSEEDD